MTTVCNKRPVIEPLIYASPVENRAILPSEDDYKDQIHDEAARQPRWALGIGLIIFAF
jgi:hypothetical protein